MANFASYSESQSESFSRGYFPAGSDSHCAATSLSENSAPGGGRPPRSESVSLSGRISRAGAAGPGRLLLRYCCAGEGRC